MKTLNNLKSRYRQAKKIATKIKVMNDAELNLSHEDFKRFFSWQCVYMKIERGE